MQMTSFLQDKQLTIALNGEIDHHGAKSTLRVIADKIDQYMPMLCILDFRAVTFMDSSGIGLVMGRYRLMNTMGGELLVTGASPRIRRLMQMGGLEQLPIFGKKPTSEHSSERK